MQKVRVSVCACVQDGFHRDSYWGRSASFARRGGDWAPRQRREGEGGGWRLEADELGQVRSSFSWSWWRQMSGRRKAAPWRAKHLSCRTFDVVRALSGWVSRGRQRDVLCTFAGFSWASLSSSSVHFGSLPRPQWHGGGRRRSRRRGRKPSCPTSCWWLQPVLVLLRCEE